MKYIAYLIVGFMITACGPIHKHVLLDAEHVQGMNILAVQFESKSEFEVYMDRATATAGPAVMFGLIGAMAANVHNSSKDKDREEQLSIYLDGYNHLVDVKGALFEGLNRQQRVGIVEVYDKKSMQQSGANGLLKVQIKDWGLKVTDRRYENKVKVFVDIKRVFQRTGSQKKLMSVETSYVSDTSRDFSEYVHDGELLKSELHSVMQNAGQQIAAKMVYLIGEKP